MTECTDQAHVARSPSRLGAAALARRRLRRRRDDGTASGIRHRGDAASKGKKGGKLTVLSPATSTHRPG